MLTCNKVSFQDVDSFIVIGLDSDFGEDLLKLFGVGEGEKGQINEGKAEFLWPMAGLNNLFEEGSDHYDKKI